MLKFVFWDVQHGSAAYICTPGGQHLAVDLGTGSYENSNVQFSPLLFLKHHWQIPRLDAVIITHPHRDHLDDIVNFDQLSPRVLHRPKHLSEETVRAGNRSEDKDIIDKYLEIHRRYNHPVPDETNPLEPNNNGGVLVQKFTPSACAQSNLNNHSTVMVISYAQSKMLIAGDNEPPSWNELLEKDTFSQAIKGTDIFLAPHHGRQSGFSPELFKHFSPLLTVISDGRFSDTSATDRYAAHTQGWDVHRRNGGTQQRKCVTTRNDGVIVVEFGINQNQSPFISVTID